jgi:hypothetical protein
VPAVCHIHFRTECSTARRSERKSWQPNGRTISCGYHSSGLNFVTLLSGKTYGSKRWKVRVFEGCWEEQSLCLTLVVKVNLSLYTSCRHTGKRRYNSSHFDLDSGWMRVVSFTPSESASSSIEQKSVLSRKPVLTIRWREKLLYLPVFESWVV